MKKIFSLILFTFLTCSVGIAKIINTIEITAEFKSKEIITDTSKALIIIDSLIKSYNELSGKSEFTSALEVIKKAKKYP